MKLRKDKGLYKHNDVTAIVSHCANPKCLMGRKKGEPAKIDQQGITPHAADRSWPITTLADGSRILKFCSVGCCHFYQQAQSKLPKRDRDTDPGGILCDNCGNEVDASPHIGGRTWFCQNCWAECCPPLTQEQRDKIAVLLSGLRY